MQGPFKIGDDGSVYIKREVDVNYPLGLYFNVNGNSSKVDGYEVDGDNLHVETVFFTKINNQKMLLYLYLGSSCMLLKILMELHIKSMHIRTINVILL